MKFQLKTVFSTLVLLGAVGVATQAFAAAIAPTIDILITVTNITSSDETVFYTTSAGPTEHSIKVSGGGGIGQLPYTLCNDNNTKDPYGSCIVNFGLQSNNYPTGVTIKYSSSEGPRIDHFCTTAGFCATATYVADTKNPAQFEVSLDLTALSKNN